MGSHRSLSYPKVISLIFLLSISLVWLPAHGQQAVEQWKRFETIIENPGWDGNPFDIILTARFTHVESGDAKQQFGFYAGGNTWKIYFMPDRVGDWSFETISADPDLDSVSGGFIAIEPSISGPINPGVRLWRTSDGRATSPVILAVGPYVRSNAVSETQGLVDWAAETAGATHLGTTLLNFAGDGVYTDSQEDRMYVDGSEGIEFYLPTWDRSNAFYDAVRDSGMGHYIMIYSDDRSSPNTHGIPEGSGGTIGEAELRLFRYLVARFAPYPKVIWDSGIDIGETRSDEWINNFVAWFQQNDPWNHPISSRNGGGSGGIHPSRADYFSDGERTLPSRADLVATVERRSVPTAMTDRYRENYTSPFDGGRIKIREAAWQMALTYGTGVYFGGSDAGGYLVSTYESDFEAAPDLGVLRDFLQTKVLDLSMLVPRDDLVSAGDAWVSTDGENEYVIYSRSGLEFRVSVSLVDDEFSAYWYDPVSAEVVSAQHLMDQVSGIDAVKPGNNAGGSLDWILHIKRSAPITRPKRPESLRAD